MFAASLAAGLAGCGTIPEELPVQDRSSPVVSARASIRPVAWSRGDSSWPGLEIGIERYRASDTRTIPTGQTLNLNGRIVSGPDTLAQTATVQIAHFVYTHRFRFGPGFELEPFGGLARIDMRYEGTLSAGATERMREAQRALYGGITPRWRFNDWSAIELRAAAIDSGLLQGRDTEIALVLKPAPQLALRMGVSDRRHEGELNGLFGNKVIVRSRGPMASLLLEF